MDSVGHGSLLAGRYRLEERQPGTDATLWLGVDETLDRQVRVRLIPPGHPYGADVVDAARRAVLVEDPRLERVLDVQDTGEQAFIVTERLLGRDLADLTREGPISPEAARRLVGEAAQALERAGARGLHHRRLGVRDLVVLPDGSVKILGTAIAAALDGLDQEGLVDAGREDAVGLVRLLYAGLTARWPGRGDQGLPPAPVEAGQPAPPRIFAPAVPNDLDTLCTVTLGPRHDGPDSPAELAHQLAPWSAREPVYPARSLFEPAQQQGSQPEHERQPQPVLDPRPEPVFFAPPVPAPVPPLTAPVPVASAAPPVAPQVAPVAFETASALPTILPRDPEPHAAPPVQQYQPVQPSAPSEPSAPVSPAPLVSPAPPVSPPPPVSPSPHVSRPPQASRAPSHAALFHRVTFSRTRSQRVPSSQAPPWRAPQRRTPSQRCRVTKAPTRWSVPIPPSLWRSPADPTGPALLSIPAPSSGSGTPNPWSEPAPELHPHLATPGHLSAPHPQGGSRGWPPSSSRASAPLRRGGCSQGRRAGRPRTPSSGHERFRVQSLCPVSSSPSGLSGRPSLWNGRPGTRAGPYSSWSSASSSSA